MMNKKLSTGSTNVNGQLENRIYSNDMIDCFKNKKAEIIKELDEKLDDLLHCTTLKIKSNDSETLEKIYKNYYDYNTGSKILKNRDSYLTYLFNDQNFLTIYNIFISGLILSVLNHLYKCFFNPNNKDITFVEDILHFSYEIPVLLTVLFKQIGLMCLIYPIYYQFYKSDIFINRFLFYIVWTNIFGIFIFVFMWGSIKMIGSFENSMISTMAITCEQVRLLMKMWAFLRENIHKAIHKHQNKKEHDKCPTFTQFLYFMFAPTLVYRDSYPKRENIRWAFVIMNLLGSVMCVASVVIILEHYFKPTFQKFGLVKFSYIKFLGILLEGVLPSILVMNCLFYGFLHCWLNSWAEMLRFGDRMFYQDWWNSNSYADYYKKWNIIVHDWLRSYIFNDIKRSLDPKISGIVGSFVTINVSALVHEYIMVMVMRSFCPVFIIQFGIIGLIAKFVTPSNTNGKTLNRWNIYLWTSFMFGNSLLISFYFAEWYAVRNCPLPNSSSKINKIIPRFMTADCY